VNATDYSRPAQPIRLARPSPSLLSDSKIRFRFTKRVHTAADGNWKVQNNCFLLYFTNSPPTAVVSIVLAWMLNTEIETGLEIYKRRSFEASTRSRLMLPILKPHRRCLQRVGYWFHCSRCHKNFVETISLRQWEYCIFLASGNFWVYFCFCLTRMPHQRGLFQHQSA